MDAKTHQAALPESSAALPRFVQIHTLASYPAALLNRDDSGLAKRMPFGGAVRARVSSQALKRKWRFAGEADHESARRAPHALQNLDVPMGDRSKELVERVVMPRALRARAGHAAVHDSVLAVIEEGLIVALYGSKAADPKNRQALFFGHPETEYIAGVAQELLDRAAADGLVASGAAPDKKAIKAFTEHCTEHLKPLRKNLIALTRATAGAAGLEAALFGRMVTADPQANLAAPVHVAHAFTVHAIERELDYVTAVDDLRSRGDDAEAGSAGIFDTEITSGLFYGYVVIDVNLLVSNLNGDVPLAVRVIGSLMRLIAKTSPGAKKGSTAPYAHAELMLVEIGDDQPRTLANAFRRAVPLQGDVLVSAVDAMQEHLEGLDAAYGAMTRRVQLSASQAGLRGIERSGLEGICTWVGTGLVAREAA